MNDAAAVLCVSVVIAAPGVAYAVVRHLVRRHRARQIALSFFASIRMSKNALEILLRAEGDGHVR